MDADAVAEGIEKIHTEYASTIQYNNENSLSSVLTIAYLSAMQYYFKPIRELPTGRGFADFVFIPASNEPNIRTSAATWLVARGNKGNKYMAFLKKQLTVNMVYTLR